jgi:polar amino acid transport system substrate-binding protein
MKAIGLLGALALAAGCAQAPTAPSPEAKSQLAPSGTLRVAVLTSNPIIGSKDASSGELKGTTVELGRALGARAGVPVQMIEYAAIPKLMEDSGTNAWDVAVVAIDPLPGSRLLDDAFSGLQLAFALPKNRPEAAKYFAAFVEDAKKSGEVQRAIDKAGLAGEVRVAPLE